MNKWGKILIMRRIVQFTILILFMGSARGVWHILKGNYSTADFMGWFHLTDPYALLQIFATGFLPKWDIILGALLVSAFYFLLRGRMFCSWVCPVNIVTDLASNLRRRWHIQPFLKESQISRSLRFYILAMGLLLSAIFGLAAFEWINPISYFHRALIFGSVSGLFLTAFIFFLDLLVLPHAWCGHLCPVGAYYAALGNFGVLKILHEKEKCTHCAKCKIVCPEKQVLNLIGEKTYNISMGACTNCARCIEVCDDDALNFKITIKK